MQHPFELKISDLGAIDLKIKELLQDETEKILGGRTLTNIGREEGMTTQAIDEERGIITTQAIGEEGGDWC